MMDIIKCYSVLVASGNGQRCNDLRQALRDNLLEVDDETQKYKIAIWKYGKKSEPEAHLRIAKSVALVVGPLFGDIDDHFLSVDKPNRGSVRS